ncbi:hypothetical protein GCM10012288_02580 [Malaciobacter pacificus]|uniref:Uncharacterized protein n=1 Tax=Malaciobacter pacificus TaxID=1080223 RepID=A0A5C2H7Q5_9BACT|nr:hypothetical protein [Malaciobacter pacificus]QEP33515.1 hypothetical protein APAC_0353 [Malaciobacter pacificus]GGD32131.1 hypothetical protein GCM10012288_02580 [Malaciobacter pacificus]
MKYLILILIITTSLFSKNVKIDKAVAVGIFDENGNGENIQHLRETKNDYNGLCYSKIVVFGNYQNQKIDVKIGKSIGHKIKSIPIYSKNKTKIGEEISFKHYNITKGYFEVKIENKLFDTKVFVK